MAYAPNMSKWGKEKARERYGELKQADLSVKGTPWAPQAPEDKHAAGYSNDHADDWVRGGGNGGATGKPGFDKGPVHGSR